MSTSGSQRKATFVLPSLPPGILYTVNRGHISRSKTSTSPPPPSGEVPPHPQPGPCPPRRGEAGGSLSLLAGWPGCGLRLGQRLLLLLVVVVGGLQQQQPQPPPLRIYCRDRKRERKRESWEGCHIQYGGLLI